MGGMYIDRMMHFPNGFLLLHVTKTHQNDAVCHYLLILWSSGYKRWSRVFSFLDGCDFNLWGRHGIHVLWSRGTNRSSIKRKNLLRKKSWELLPLLLKKSYELSPLLWKTIYACKLNECSIGFIFGEAVNLYKSHFHTTIAQSHQKKK